MSDQNLNLFEDLELDCDHLPVGQREFVGDFLVCTRCGKKLRPKNYKSDE